MYVKKNFYFLLMAALVCGLSLSVTSCKSDDDDSDNNGDGIEGLSTLENDQLADLIAAWTDTSRDDLNGTEWLNNQYEPTVGLALDESNPGIRRIAAGTVEEADTIAASMLGTLGIDYEKPAGFTYSNSQVGTVEYSHGEGNTLASISVNIRQIPVLQEIRFVKDLGENASGKPYYKCGDIVKYKNRFYVCVSKHKYGQEARFITLNDQDTHTKGKFTWKGVGNDTVYNDDMAKAEVLGDWLQNVVCNGTMWNSVVSRMISTKNVQSIRQLVPEDNNIRVSFINTLISDESYIPELQKPNPLMKGTLFQYSNFAWKDRIDDETDILTGTFAPVGFLLADKLRWTLITDKWVPYIFLVKGEDTFNKVYDLELSAIKSQYKDASHFKFKALNKFKITDNDELIGMSSLQDKNGGSSNNFIKADTYYVCVIGMHWTHEQFYDELSNVKALFNFCCDYLYHPNKKQRERFNQYPTEWGYRNITSRSFTVTDKGSKAKNCTDVSIQK
jgi:hypothetical protein